jgi:phosphatidylglycerol lysyltransferase
MSWRAVQVAEEAVVGLGQLQFRGKRFQDVRTALNKAKALGIEAHRIRFRDASPDLAEQIRSLSAEWLANKRLPEMGFTLGTVDELADDDVLCVVAVDPAGDLHAVTSWLPVRADGRIIGWTLDLMRRSPAAFPGVMEFLIATMALSCRSDGAEVLSLSGAPLARMDRGEQGDLLQRFLDFVGLRLEPVYGFRSLLAFKAKFRPQYRPLFMAYPDAAALPSIGSAVTRAYLPRLTVHQAVRLLWIVLASLPRHRRGEAVVSDA